MPRSPKPRIVFSRCLGFDRCRYNGVTITDRVVELLKPFVEPITICPEVGIGLGVPRPPIRLIEDADRIALFQPETGRDLTDAMRSFTDAFLSSLDDIDGFLLKYRSPSCGPSQVKVYHSRQPNAGHRKGSGAFAARALERFGDLPIEDEGRLQSFDIRGHYLTRLFTMARFRAVAAESTMASLVTFHAEHKLLLLAYNQTAMRAMGRIVANADRRPTLDVIARYRTELARALARAPRRRSAVNVLQHAFGYVSDRLTPAERAHFLDALDAYRQSQVPLSAPTMLIRSWILRFGVDYLADQVWFEPYPHQLVEVLDSGKGRPL